MDEEEEDIRRISKKLGRHRTYSERKGKSTSTRSQSSNGVG